MNQNLNNRRNFIKASGALAVAGAGLMAGCQTSGGASASGKVVVVGGGFAGATVAKYLRMWSNKAVEVTLIEPSDNFFSCPYSNLVLVGAKKMSEITHSYNNLATKHGVKVVKDMVNAIDTAKKTVKTAGGATYDYDKLVIAPGIAFDYSAMGALAKDDVQKQVMHAYKAGAQTIQLAKQIESMSDGGIIALTIPKAPYRCSPGPYERASLIAEYLKKNKAKSKILVLDANEKIQAKEDLFKKAWEDLYKGIIEYRPNSEVKDVKIANGKFTAVTDFDEVKADVLNVIPNQRVGDLVAKAGLKLVNNRWADINYLDFESSGTPNVHIIGDSIFPAPTMPKSATMANQHAKVCAAAILDKLAGNSINQSPVVLNACYSFVAQNSVIHVASVHQYDGATKTYQPVKGAGGLSRERNALEVDHANAWATNIWADVLS